MHVLRLIISGMLLVESLFELIRSCLRLYFAHGFCGHVLVKLPVRRLLDRKRSAHAVQLLGHPGNSIETIHFLSGLHLLKPQGVDILLSGIRHVVLRQGRRVRRRDVLGQSLIQDVVGLLLLLLGRHLPASWTFGQFLLDQVLLSLEADECGAFADDEPDLIISFAAAMPGFCPRCDLRPVHQLPSSLVADSRGGVRTRSKRRCEPA